MPPLFEKIDGTQAAAFQVGAGDANALQAWRRGDALLAEDPTDIGTTYAQTLSGLQTTREAWTRVDGTLAKTVDYVYAGQYVSSAVTKVYASDGVTIVAQRTEAYAWTPGGVGAPAATITATRNV